MTIRESIKASKNHDQYEPHVETSIHAKQRQYQYWKTLDLPVEEMLTSEFDLTTQYQMFQPTGVKKSICVEDVVEKPHDFKELLTTVMQEDLSMPMVIVHKTTCIPTKNGFKELDMWNIDFGIYKLIKTIILGKNTILVKRLAVSKT